MKRKIIGIFICTLLIATILPITATAGDPENPEFEDRTGDVKLFGIIKWFQKSSFKYVDIMSSWFSEDSSNIEYLYVSLELKDLEYKSEGFNAFYSVGWSFDNNFFITSVHIDSNGISDFKIGKSTDEDDDIDYTEICEGIFDVENNIITWIVPKDTIENPQPGDRIYNILPYTYIQLTNKLTFNFMNLFKDLPWNAKITKDYTIQY